jgi:hypothetical protein
LDIDWNESPLNYTCYHPKNPLPIMTEVKSIEECDNIPDGYYVILFMFYKLMIKLYLKITYE